jgi:phosphoribosylformylglycinamidine synthase subunit PurQ / glutaminase
MSQAETAILYAPGTNCHEETAAAIELAGGTNELVLLRDLLDGRIGLKRFRAAVIPGGFAYGDHLGAGRIFGTMLAMRLREQLSDFLGAKKPLLGVCNGFQVLADAGILPARTPGKRSMALLENQGGHFEDRKIRLVVSEQKSLWTDGLAGEVLQMPVGHGEGRPLFCETGPAATPHVAFRYCDSEGKPTNHYPENPNGAPGAVAGITDETGTILGLMPHPERAALPAHYSQDGLKVFRNLVRWLRRNT